MEFCSNCRKDAEVVLDRRSGDAICTACGLILGSCYVQTRPVVQEPCIIDDERESKDSSDDDGDDVIIIEERVFKGVSNDDEDDVVADSPDVTSDDVQAEADGPIPQRYWASLDLGAEDVEAVSGTLAKLEEAGIRSSRKDFEAAVVYMIGQLCNDKLTLEDVSKAADVEKWEIEDTYEDVYYLASTVIPQWYQKLKDINKLCTP